MTKMSFMKSMVSLMCVSIASCQTNPLHMQIKAIPHNVLCMEGELGLRLYSLYNIIVMLSTK